MLLWTKIKPKNLQVCVDHATSCAHFCKKKHTQEGAWLLCIIFCNRNYKGDTGQFIYKALILGNKQLLSNMVDSEATYVPYTTAIAFLQIAIYFAQTTQPFFAL